MHRGVLFGVLLGTVVTIGCASSQAVPRPFPGAAPPPPLPAAQPPPPPTTSVSPAPSNEPVAVTPSVEPAPAVVSADWTSTLVAAALSFRGTPYRNGGADPSGFDCSGFVRYVFAQIGRQLPREVQAQFKAGRSIERDQVAAGDLVFFETVSKGASHVGIALGNGEFVHAPSSRGVVRTERYTIDYWAKRWVGARRILEDANDPLTRSELVDPEPARAQAAQ